MRPTTRRSALLIALLALASVPLRAHGPALQEAEAPRNLHLVLLHTNDMHGQVLPREHRGKTVGGLPRVAAKVRELRRSLEAEVDGVLVVDGGDWFQGTPEGQVEGGSAFIDAMADVGYDVAVIGNHEFDLGVPHLLGLLGEARLPTVCANVIDPDTEERVDWIEPYRILEVAGARIGVVGVVSADTPRLSHPDTRALVFEDPAVAVARARRELEGRVDWILALTHIGREHDHEIAQAHPYRLPHSAALQLRPSNAPAAPLGEGPPVPVIVGGHGHRYLPDGERTGGTLIAQAGEKATVLGRIDLWLDPETKLPVRATARLVELDAEPEALDRVPAVESACERLAEAAEQEMGRVVGRVTSPIERRFDWKSSTAGNWISDCLRAHTGADVAFHNRGGIRSKIEAGDVRRRDVFELAPFPNHLVTMTLTGEELWALLERSVAKGSRSTLEGSGIVVRLVPETPDAAGALVEVKLGGRELDRARDYRVTTNSFLAAGGDGFVEFEAGRERIEDPLLLCELLEDALEAAGELDPPRDERFAVVEPGGGGR